MGGICIVMGHMAARFVKKEIKKKKRNEFPLKISYSQEHVRSDNSELEKMDQDDVKSAGMVTSYAFTIFFGGIIHFRMTLKT